MWEVLPPLLSQYDGGMEGAQLRLRHTVRQCHRVDVSLPVLLPGAAVKGPVCKIFKEARYLRKHA